MNGYAKNKSFFSLLPLYLVIFFGFLGYSLTITIFTPMFLNYNSFNILSNKAVTLGFLLCLYPLGQFISSPILGALSDKYGRKPTLAVSLILSIIWYVLIIISLITYQLWLLMISCFLCGLSEGNVVIAQGSISDVSDETNRVKLFGYIYLFASLSFIIGPLAGGKLADPNLFSGFSFYTPFMVVAVLLVFVLLMVLLVFTETKVKKEEKISLFFAMTNLVNIFKKSEIRFLYLINFLIYFAIFGFFRSFPMYIIDTFNMSVSRESEFIAWVAVPIIISNMFLTGFLSKYFNVKSITVVSSILMGFFMFIVILPKYEGALWITLFLTAIPIALCLPACATVLSLLVSQKSQGKVMGNNQSLNVGSEVVSGLAAGFIASVNYSLPLIVLAVISIIAGVMLWLSPYKLVKNNKKIEI